MRPQLASRDKACDLGILNYNRYKRLAVIIGAIWP